MAGYKPLANQKMWLPHLMAIWAYALKIPQVK